MPSFPHIQHGRPSDAAPSLVFALVALAQFMVVLDTAISNVALPVIKQQLGFTFPEGRQRSRALGYWSMVATGGAAVGLLLCGVLTQYAGWRWNFFINVPIGLAVSVLITRFVPAHASARDRRALDAPGALLVTVGL